MPSFLQHSFSNFFVKIVTKITNSILSYNHETFRPRGQKSMLLYFSSFVALFAKYFPSPNILGVVYEVQVAAVLKILHEKCPR